MRISPFSPIFAICILIGMYGCGKKEKAPDTPKSNTVTNILLEPGTGAVLVKHPKPHRFDRSQWMIQIQLEGELSTDTLPMIPIADLQAGLMLNVPPGTYKVISSAWIRKYPPASGGSLENVLVNAGELVELKAGGVGMDEFPYPNTKLTIGKREKWTLQSPNKLQEFIASVVE